MLYMRNRARYVIVLVYSALALLVGVVGVSSLEGGGVSIRAHGAVEAWESHNISTDTGISTRPSIGFTAGGDILYRLPLQFINVDIGIGAKYLFDRQVDDGGSQYSFLPLYLNARLPFGMPGDNVFSIYLEGRVGYSFLFANDAYRDAYLNGDITYGGLYLGVGLGTLFQLNDVLSLFVSVAFENANGGSSSGEVINHAFDVAAGIGIDL